MQAHREKLAELPGHPPSIGHVASLTDLRSHVAQRFGKALPFPADNTDTRTQCVTDDNGNSVMGVPQDELDEVLAEAAEAIPETVAGIYEYWQRKHT